MTDSLDRSFGLLIAFLLPGFLGVVGVAAASPTVEHWLSSPPATEPTLGGFSYVLLSSVGVGMAASAVRWLFIDKLMHLSGLRPPQVDFSRLQANLAAFDLAVQHNYRHYQCYANTSVVLTGIAVGRAATIGGMNCGAWLAFALGQAVMLLAGRDCLKRFYERMGQIIAALAPTSKQR